MSSRSVKLLNMTNFLQVVLLCCLYAVLNVLGASIIKKELQYCSLEKVEDYFYFLLRLKVILAFFIILLSALTIFKALSLTKFSIVTPIATSVNFVLTVSVGYFYFHDNLTWKHFVGLILILAGVTLIGLAERSGN